MTCLINEGTRVAVHGILASYAQAQLKSMREAGTNIVAGVSVGSGGTSSNGVPVFDTMQDAVEKTGANASIIFVPAAGFLDAVVENADAGIKLIVGVAEHVPLQDGLRAAAYARRSKAWLVGPNTLGLVMPGIGMLGSFSLQYAKPGSIAVISRSGSLSTNTIRQIALAGLGLSAGVHIGGDYICGRNPGEYLEVLDKDERTKVIVYCGEIGGTKEYDLTRSLKSIGKPVVSMIVGRWAPSEKTLGHAGALILSDRDTARAKCEALQAAGVHIARNLVEVASMASSLSR